MTAVIECGACWAKAVRQVAPRKGAVLHHTYQLMLAQHDRAADRRAHAEHPELFNPAAWHTGDRVTDLTAGQLAEQPARPVIRLYDRNWNYAIDTPGVYALPRTVARDYPPVEPPEARALRDLAALVDTTGYRGGITVPAWLARAWRTSPTPTPRTDFMPRYPRGDRR